MVIDVDAWEPSQPTGPTPPADDDSDVEFLGFLRTHLQDDRKKELDNDGFAYTGFNARGAKRAAPRPQAGNSRPPTGNGSSSHTPTASGQPEFIVISDDEGPPAKRRRVSFQNLRTNVEVVVPAIRTTQSGRSNAGATLRSAQAAPPVVRNPVAQECMRVQETAMSIDEDEDQDSDDDDFITDGLYPWNDREIPTNAHRVYLRDEELAARDLSVRLAALSVSEDFSRHPLDRLAQVQEQYAPNPHPEMTRIFASKTFGKLSSSTARTSVGMCRTTYSAFRPRSAYAPPSMHPCALKTTKVIHQAPGDINTIIQMGRIVVVASSVADGAIDDIPGDYNEKGSLSVWNGECAVILSNHSKKVARSAVHEQTHYFTVNDIASDPMYPTRFVSAGRDNKLLFWDTVTQNGVRRLPREKKYPDNPEVVKYQPGEVNLAVQCNDGSVYIIREGNAGLDGALIVAQSQLKHFTADMHWGSGRTKNLIFASSACPTDGTGIHRAFDVVKTKAVMDFDANKQACSTLTMDPCGDNLYVATEGPDSRYTLRRYDVRHRSHNRKAKQQVDLEPFAGNPATGETDINCLSVSSDGIYIAAGRTDNRLDVYDARMLTRGALYNFSHEDGGSEADSYGVVKVQWVESVPYGTGFLSGGVDGCVRLWDMKYAGDDPRNGEVLARCDYDVATFTLGNMYEGEAPIVVGERSGKVTMFGYQRPDPWD